MNVIITCVTKCPLYSIPLIDQRRKPAATKNTEFNPKCPSENKSFDKPANQFAIVLRLKSVRKE
ncbi:MAG: hypothetical protein A2099_05355 [Planctomycetes bacterium GWF2_39_10]|jgi:hypothetical protein|nr:MAG: hypothetical protein A2099_05355 [Planctomycetes bacterium GWF2_39_10]OHC01148.1 MAG: hypothetical protein A3G70_08160 [Planctomycetes bacterium RIFCSPLOWO2_12_FULL_39_13]